MQWPLPPLPGVPLDLPYDDEFVERYAFSEDGVDLMLIWESLHRTPTERVAVLQDWVNAFGQFMVEDVGDSGPDR